jgi:hypothetical protein
LSTVSKRGFDTVMIQAIRKLDLVEAIKRNREEKARLDARLIELDRERAGLQTMLEQFDKIAATLGRVNGNRIGGSAGNGAGAAKAVRKKAAPPLPARPQTHAAGPKPARDSQGGRRRRSSEVSGALRRLIQAQTDEYTGPQIVEQLRKSDPAMAEKVPAGYMSTLLWRMAQARQISLVRRGAPGEPHVYCSAKK